MNLKFLGVLLISGIAAEELSSFIEFGEENLQPYKRSAKHTRSVDTYDTTEVIGVNEPADASGWGGHRCHNTGVFAVVAAVELGYTLVTGTVRKFSEQELIDCFYRGCYPTSASSIARSLIVNDRLAQADHYTPYQARRDICRAALSPDGLDKVEITDVFSVSVNDVEEAIREYGSVTSCMDLSDRNCPMYHDYEYGIINGKAINKCNHLVNIVGYTKDYYKIRDHRGSKWGEAGYFRIARGGNACGVENRMVALSVRKREGKKPLAPNGCPLSAPIYCNDLRTCTTKHQPCVKAKSTRAKRSSSNSTVAKCADEPSFACASYKAYCDKITRIADNCKKTCDRCATEVSTGKCKDDPNIKCATYETYCKKSPLVKRRCPKTCKLPDSECTTVDPSRHPKDTRERPKRGQCYVPDIPNGIVMLSDNGMLEMAAELHIICNKGYVLAGRQNYCGIQKIYGPDSRLMQSCMKVNSEAFTSKGYDYQGMATEPVTVSASVRCDNWNEIVLRGKFLYFTTDVAMAKSLMFGNHRFCRNSVELDHPVPFCFVGTNTIAYCKEYPGCELCEDVVKDLDPYCAEYAPERCPYSSEYKLYRNKDAWHYCQRTCCDHGGCV